MNLLAGLVMASIRISYQTGTYIFQKGTVDGILTPVFQVDGTVLKIYQREEILVLDPLVRGGILSTKRQIVKICMRKMGNLR